MIRSELLSEIIEEESGQIVDGDAIIKEVAEIAQCYDGEEKITWLTGRDDSLMKWDYYVEVEKKYNEISGKWETEVDLLELNIIDKLANLT